jgi:hypothetical protein
MDVLPLVFQVRAFSISLFHKRNRSMPRGVWIMSRLAMKSDREETFIGEGKKRVFSAKHISFPSSLTRSGN